MNTYPGIIKSLQADEAVIIVSYPNKSYDFKYPTANILYNNQPCPLMYLNIEAGLKITVGINQIYSVELDDIIHRITYGKVKSYRPETNKIDVCSFNEANGFECFDTFIYNHDNSQISTDRINDLLNRPVEIHLKGDSCIYIKVLSNPLPNINAVLMSVDNNIATFKGFLSEESSVFIALVDECYLNKANKPLSNSSINKYIGHDATICVFLAAFRVNIQENREYQKPLEINDSIVPAQNKNENFEIFFQKIGIDQDLPNDFNGSLKNDQ